MRRKFAARYILNLKIYASKGLKKDEQRKILLNGGYFQPYGADSVGCRKHVLQRVYLQRVFGFGGANISHGVALFAAATANQRSLSGRLPTRWEKRKIFITSGYILWGVSLNGFRAFTKRTLSESSFPQRALRRSASLWSS